MNEPDRFTSHPVVWKAHGTAEATENSVNGEPRSAGLLQAPLTEFSVASKAVLEQPSSRRMLGKALGRRNIALWQNHELNRSARRVCCTRPEGHAATGHFI